MSGPTVVIHGGAGSAMDGGPRERRVREALEKILDDLWEEARRGMEAQRLAERGCAALEDCGHFNAGRGSKLQRDGGIRMSAAMMEGTRRSFSGVINVEQVQNPIEIAARLQHERDRVLDGRGGQRMARQMGLELFDPIVERRFDIWCDKTRKRRLDDEDPEDGQKADGSDGGTVGVVVCDRDGDVAAATSTGGRGFERIGRVSDTATVAGNYATEAGAVSCTGTGEDIVDEALAARIVIRLEDGASLEEAVETTMDRADRRDRSFAAVAVDADGRMGWAKTTEALLGVGRDGDGRTRWAF